MRKETYEHSPEKKKKETSRKRTKRPHSPNVQNVPAARVYLSKCNKEPPCFPSYNHPNLGRLSFGELWKKQLNPTNFLSSLPSQPHSHFNYFFLPFFSFIFYSSNFHSNQTYYNLKFVLAF